MDRDSTFGTVAIAGTLCVVCSLAVSIAAVSLRPDQELNKKLDRQRNILDAAGLSIGEYGRPASELSRKQIDELYSRVSEKLVDLETGEYNTDLSIEEYDPREAVDKADMSIPIENPTYDLGEQRREKVARVYFVRKPGEEQIRQVVLPVYGKGLWSTLYGYLALKSDLKTIEGLTFYEHAETPGLGGEVDNPDWKAQWAGQKLYGDDGKPMAEVYKGPAPEGNPYTVDGLSGATITSRGVTNLLRYWASDDGYGVFLGKLKDELALDNVDKGKESEAEEKAIQEKAAEKMAADEKAKADAEKKAAEMKAADEKAAAEKKAAEKKAADEKAKAEAEMKAKADAEKKEKEAAEAKAMAEKEAAEKKAAEEKAAEMKAKEEAEKKAKAEAEEKAKAEKEKSEKKEEPKSEDSDAPESDTPESNDSEPEAGSDTEPKEGDE